MLSMQLLVQNLIYGIAQLTIPWDNVDEEELEKPVKWQIGILLKFTLCIGPVSSLFDILTFVVLWFVFSANTVADQALFQAGWFMIGLVTQILVVHVVRTKKLPFIQSIASWPVIVSSLAAIGVAFVIILTPLRQTFDFAKLPDNYWIWFVGIVVAYLITLEGAKKIYIRLTNEWL